MSCDSRHRDPAGLVAWARQQLGAGQLTAAAACLDLALRAAPSHADAHYLRGGVLVIGGDNPAAIPHFERALRFAPSHADAYFELGNAHYAARQFEGASRSYFGALQVM